MEWNMGAAFWSPLRQKAQVQLTPSVILLRYRILLWLFFHPSCYRKCCTYWHQFLLFLAIEPSWHMRFSLESFFISCFLTFYNACARSNSSCISLCIGKNQAWIGIIQPAPEMGRWPLQHAYKRTSVPRSLCDTVVEHGLWSSQAFQIFFVYLKPRFSTQLQTKQLQPLLSPCMLHISIFQGHTYFGPQVEEAEIHSFTWPEAVGICKLSRTKSSEGSRFISLVRSQGSTCGIQRYTPPKCIFVSHELISHLRTINWSSLTTTL